MDLANAPNFSGSPERTAQECDGPVSVRVVSTRDAQEPEFLARWQTLADEAAEPNPFFEHCFLLPSLKAFATNNRGLAIVAIEAGGSLIGLMPLGRTRSYYGYPVPHAATWLHANAFYGAPLVRKVRERQFWRTLFAHLDSEPGQALFLHLPHLDASGPLGHALDDVLAADRRGSVTVGEHERAMLASDLSPAEYLAGGLSKKHLKELRRKRRRLEECGKLTFERRSDADGIDEWVAEFLALEAAGWKGSSGSALASDPDTAAFSAEALKRAARSGRLERATLRLDGKPIAMLSSFVCPPGRFGFKTAFDERYSTYSPGMQLQIDCLDILEQSEIEWSDSCAAEGHPMIDRLWTERRKLVTRNIAIGGSARRAIFSALMAFETRRRSKT